MAEAPSYSTSSPSFSSSAHVAAGKRGRILDSIENLEDRLSDLIEPDFGLLEYLLNVRVLTRRQLAKVRSGDKTVYERNDALLDLLISQRKESQCQNFLNALEQTWQKHVVNATLADGRGLLTSP